MMQSCIIKPRSLMMMMMKSTWWNDDCVDRTIVLTSFRFLSLVMK